jgi:hypothetical protein
MSHVRIKTMFKTELALSDANIMRYYLSIYSFFEGGGDFLYVIFST